MEAGSHRELLIIIYLDALVTAEVKVEFRRVSYAYVDSCTRRNISTFPTLFFFIRAKQTRVMSLLHHDKCYTGSVIDLKLETRLTNSGQFMLQYSEELAFGNAVTIQNYSMRFISACALVKHYKQFP